MRFFVTSLLCILSLCLLCPASQADVLVLRTANPDGSETVETHRSGLFGTRSRIHHRRTRASVANARAAFGYSYGVAPQSYGVAPMAAPNRCPNCGAPLP